jgi:ankyrin repeat protein
LADLADPFDYSTHVNQLILQNSLLNTAPTSTLTPLHKACSSGNVTNLDFVEYLLDKGADPNAQDTDRHR